MAQLVGDVPDPGGSVADPYDRADVVDMFGAEQCIETSTELVNAPQMGSVARLRDATTRDLARREMTVLSSYDGHLDLAPAVRVPRRNHPTISLYDQHLRRCSLGGCKLLHGVGIA